jgi:transposase
MVVVPGLSESLGAVGKRIIRFDITDTLLAVEAASSAQRAKCPTCSCGSSRRHGQYQRQLRAQPCMGRSVILHVQVRRFKCLNPQCPQMTFVEPIEALAPAKHRRTVGLSGESRAIAQALGGSAAARLSAKLGIPTSRDTLLRALRRLGSELTKAPPVVVGIDDWAITRGHRYGTIMVDLERRRPIEVLDGRESTSVAEWLQRHPSIQVVARDRAGRTLTLHRMQFLAPSRLPIVGIYWSICAKLLSGCCGVTPPSYARQLSWQTEASNRRRSRFRRKQRSR